MTDLRKAAEMALEVLEALNCGDNYKTHNAATALRQALAQPEWVGLTDEEIVQCYIHSDFNDHYKAVEAKLKEKNT